METIIWLDKVTNEKVIRSVKLMKTCKSWTLFGKWNIDRLVMFSYTTVLRMTLLKTEWEVNQQAGRD